MKLRRVVLEEMGIAPLWRLRRSPGDSVGVHPDAPVTTVDQAPAAPTQRLPTAPSPLERVATAGRLPAQPAPVSAAAAEPDARRQQILQMDWAALKASVASCVACALHQKRTQTVFGVGDEQADWLFVGEGPGAEEDAQGEPFVGQAGRLLDNMLLAIDLKRGEDVYIANVVKCRPPSNRNPESREMSCCEPYLARQIALIEPKLIIAMGKTAASHLLHTDVSVASLRGRLHDYHGTPLIVTYHPAYLLRTLADKAKSWADLCFARETMAALRKQTAQA